MKPIKCLFVTALTVAALTFGAWAQTAAAPKPTPQAAAVTAAQPAVTAADVQALREGLAAALQQIQALHEQLRQRDQAVEHAQITAADAAAKADAAQQQAAQQQQTVGDLQDAVAGLKSVSASSFNQPVLKNAVLTVDDSGQAAKAEPEQEVLNKQMESPITIRFRGINITPGGYSEGAFVWRQHSLGADLPTPYNSIPVPGASQSHLSDFFGSGRQSKITTFVDGRAGQVDLSAYVSADFLSAGVTSTSTQTNSYTLRLRQAWGQAKLNNGFSFLAGQAWSLVTEDAKSIAIDDDMGKTSDVRPKVIDPSYNVGFNFARQWGFRVTKAFGDKVAVAFAVENPQATVTTHSNAFVTVGATTVTTPTGTTTVGGTAYYNFLVGQAGASNSYNSTGTYSFNPAPDIIAKVAFDPGFGHYEIYGLATRFTGRAFPCVENWVATASACNPTGSTAPTASQLALLAYNASKEGGGFGASARWNLFDKHITFGLKGFGGSGVGRYAPGGLPDASINPNGTIHLVKNLHGLGTLEWHTKKLDVNAYGGVEYAARSYGYDSTILPGATTAVGYVGYGAPGFNNSGCYTELPPTASNGFTPGGTGKCTGDTRALIEGTLQLWYKFYSGPRGRFQFGTQYSYLTRNTWSGLGGLPKGSTAGLQPGGIENMIFASFRYYLP